MAADKARIYEEFMQRREAAALNRARAQGGVVRPPNVGALIISLKVTVILVKIKVLVKVTADSTSDLFKWHYISNQTELDWILSKLIGSNAKEGNQNDKRTGQTYI